MKGADHQKNALNIAKASSMVENLFSADRNLNLASSSSTKNNEAKARAVNNWFM